MRLKSAFLILLFIFFNNNVKLSVSRRIVQKLEPRSFVFFRSNTINQKPCVCATNFSCSCCESAKIFYTSQEKKLCFNMVFEPTGLNFELSLDSVAIKTITVREFKPFRTCSSVPGLFFSTICINVLELNQFPRSITVCPRIEVLSKKDRWQITYICSSLSTDPQLSASPPPSMQTLRPMGSAAPGPPASGPSAFGAPGQLPIPVPPGSQPGLIPGPPAMQIMPASPPPGVGSSLPSGLPPPGRQPGSMPGPSLMQIMPASAPLGSPGQPPMQTPARPSPGPMVMQMVPPVASMQLTRPASYTESVTGQKPPVTIGGIPPKPTVETQTLVESLTGHNTPASMVGSNSSKSSGGQSRMPVVPIEQKFEETTPIEKIPTISTVTSTNLVSISPNGLNSDDTSLTSIPESTIPQIPNFSVDQIRQLITFLPQILTPVSSKLTATLNSKMYSQTVEKNFYQKF